MEAFVIFNYGALVGDVYLAHAENAFRRPAEYVPIAFSLVAAIALLAVLPSRARGRAAGAWRAAGYVIGAGSVVVGIAGVVLHLDSQFFYARTIRSLTYAAPFAAPLAFAGLGLALVANRMMRAGSREWSEWMLFFAAGGFAGNFVFSLTDHATNGFFSRAEWIPVASAAFATAFLLLPLVTSVTRPFLGIVAAVMAAQVVVGVLGFALHVRADLARTGMSLIERVTTAAPPFAPLLFVNLSILAAIAIRALAPHLPER